MSLPSGTVTFLFTDIEGSTERWELHGDAMKAAVARHEQIVSDSVTRHDGFVFKTLGDAFCVAFPTAPQAIEAAIEAQQALASEDFSAVDGLNVRMAIHTGIAEERKRDYFGPVVNRVARLTSIGHGGQVLLSGAARGLVRDALPGGATFVDLGSHRLKDLTKPEHVWQLGISGLPAEFPPLRSLDARPNNLPLQLTTLVGRETDLADVKALVDHHRLVTLVGSGGVGKTRLATQAGAELLDRNPDGVWFVDFTSITDPELVSSVTAQALGMSQKTDRRVDESIPVWLARKKLLLIFDNCEHLLEAVVKLAAAILRTAPDVHILNTSRQPLGIGGEAVHRLPSLSVPADVRGLTAEEAIHHGAIALFVDRAQAADTRFVLSDDTAPIIADICRRLDGIPLAIELAAARVKVLSIPNLAQRLNERFKLLTGGGREALPRQKTLSALIDWSHALLTPPEQSLFRKLGIFAGGFGLDAATRVCADDGADEIEVLDLLASLTDKSLVVADTSEEQARYRLLESTRAYALERLDASGERESVARRHAEHFRTRAQAPDHHLNLYGEWLAQGELDLDNFRSALEWALVKGNDPVLGAGIVGLIGLLWITRGLNAEHFYWTTIALERIREEEQPVLVARLAYAIATESSGKRKHEAAARSVRLCDSVGEHRLGAYARRTLAFSLYEMGRLEEASQENARALATLRECQDKRGVASCLHEQGSIERGRGDLRAARDAFGQAMTSFRALGNEAAVARATRSMAEVEFDDGHPEDALRLASGALEILLRGKEAKSIATSYVNIAPYRMALGDIVGAREAAREGLRWSRQARREITTLCALQHLAVIACLGDDPERAARLLGYVDAHLRELAAQREPTERREYEKLVVALREKLGGDELVTLTTDGAGWSEDIALEEALKV